MSGGAFWSGLFFVSAGHYRFSPERNLVLAAVMGVVYAAVARLSGPVFRRAVPRRVLAGALGVWGTIATLPVLFPAAEPVLWLTALVGSAASAVTWPVVESYLSAGRHGAEMRSAIGWFNVTWTPATAVSLFLMPLAARANLTFAIAISSVACLAALIFVARLAPAPGAHERESAAAAVGAEYPWLFRSASWLLPLSYVISSTVGPLLPHRLIEVGIEPGDAGPLAALWMIARFAALFVMWRTGFWHGRWGTLALAAGTLAAGMTLVLVAGSAAGVIGGLLAFGAGMGFTYYASLYYSMAVGHAEVEAGGNFEALIGVGYGIGPLFGLAGHLFASPTGAGMATVIVTGVALLLSSPGAIRPYLVARVARRGRTGSLHSG